MPGKRGRPTEYDPERHPFLVMCLAREGLTEKEMAQKLGIGKTTLTRWKQEHPEFRASLNGSREEADLKVVDSLYRRAIGYDYEETEMVVTSKDGEKKPARVRKVKKHVAPDVTACIFWLKNRRPAEWRDKVQQEISGPGGGAVRAEVEHSGAVDLFARIREYAKMYEQIAEEAAADGDADWDGAPEPMDTP